MELHKFSNEKGATNISADRLDENFRRLRPMPVDGPARQYAITETPDGWKLTFFLDQILESPENQNTVLSELQGLQLVEVERCDGKRMQVLGTGWY